MKKFAILLILAIAVIAYGGETATNPVEVGDIRWGRNFDAALEKSSKTGKPMLILFQEIPGCSGVKKFGREVLTNPILVEAIENEFIPMLVYNNRKGGMDQKLLERYQEPAWNYQVIRFLDAAGNDVQELATIRRYDLPLKMVVLDNNALGMVRQWQELFFDGRYSEVELHDNPDFTRVAEAFGIPAFRVEGAEDVDSAIDRLLSHRGPVLAHVPIDPRANVWPLVPPGASNDNMLDQETSPCAAH